MTCMTPPSVSRRVVGFPPASVSLQCQPTTPLTITLTKDYVTPVHNQSASFHSLHCQMTKHLIFHGMYQDLKAFVHTHTRLTALCPGLHRWASTRKVKTIWIVLKQETVSGSGISWAICKSAHCSRLITVPAHHTQFFTGWMPFLPPNQQCQSTEDKFKSFRTTSLIMLQLTRLYDSQSYTECNFQSSVQITWHILKCLKLKFNKLLQYWLLKAISPLLSTK